jgi:hypothetical protein
VCRSLARQLAAASAPVRARNQSKCLIYTVTQQPYIAPQTEVRRRLRGRAGMHRLFRYILTAEKKIGWHGMAKRLRGSTSISGRANLNAICFIYWVWINSTSMLHSWMMLHERACRQAWLV